MILYLCGTANVSGSKYTTKFDSRPIISSLMQRNRSYFFDVFVQLFACQDSSEEKDWDPVF